MSIGTEFRRAAWSHTARGHFFMRKNSKLQLNPFTIRDKLELNEWRVRKTGRSGWLSAQFVRDHCWGSKDSEARQRKAIESYAKAAGVVIVDWFLFCSCLALETRWSVAVSASSRLSQRQLSSEDPVT